MSDATAEPDQTATLAAAPGIALIAIHGVGDPEPGSTAQALAQLLVAQADYRHVGSDTWLVPVQPVHPQSEVDQPSPRVLGFSSAFVEARMLQGAATRQSMGLRDDGALADLGLQMNQHLINGTVLSDGEQVYEAHRHTLHKNGQQVHVVDMFWGDLSGLDGAIKRMATELFTLIFHLCQLGRDAALHAVLALRQ